MGCGKSSSKRKVYSNTRLSQQTKKSLNKQANLHLKQLKREQQTRPKPGRRKEIIKVRAEINEKEIKKNHRKDQ